MISLPAGLIGLVGDVHAEDQLLEEALRQLGAAGVDAILCAGDIVDGPGDADRCCQLLVEHQVLAVAGNHDRWLLADSMRGLPDATKLQDLRAESLSYLKGLPALRPFETPYGRALLCHGLGDDDMAMVGADDFGYGLDNNTEVQALRADPTVQLVINGHTHRAFVRDFGDLLVVNGGTLLRQHDPGFAVIDMQNGEVRWTAFESGESGAEGVLGRLLR